MKHSTLSNFRKKIEISIYLSLPLFLPNILLMGILHVRFALLDIHFYLESQYVKIHAHTLYSVTVYNAWSEWQALLQLHSWALTFFFFFNILFIVNISILLDAALQGNSNNRRERLSSCTKPWNGAEKAGSAFAQECWEGRTQHTALGSKDRGGLERKHCATEMSCETTKARKRKFVSGVMN